MTAASAQSTVSVYGRLDLGYNSSTTKSNADITSAQVLTAQDTKSSSFGANNSRTTSRLGFTGVEDLGGGLKAGFNYEIGLAPDNIGHKVGTGDKALDESARVGFGGTRLANLTLSGGFGSVVLGTFLNSHDSLRGFSAATFNMPGGDFVPRHVANQADTGTPGATFVAAAHSFLNNSLLDELISNGATYNSTTKAWAVGTSGLSTVELAAVVNLAAAAKAINGIGLNGRSANAMAYRSPTVGGFSVGLGLVADKTKNAPAEKADTRSVSGQTLALDYATGPLKATLVHGTAKNKDMDAATTGKTTDWGFAVSYDMGIAIPYVLHEQVKATNTALAGIALKTQATEIGAKFPMGAFTPYVSVGSGNYKITTDASIVEASIKFKTSAMQVGTTYDLSKRTYAYAAYGTDKVKVSDLYSKRSGTSIGLVHSF
jgi:predicted porin